MVKAMDMVKLAVKIGRSSLIEISKLKQRKLKLPEEKQ